VSSAGPPLDLASWHVSANTSGVSPMLFRPLGLVTHCLRSWSMMVAAHHRPRESTVHLVI
jgi:hypothetical protein